MAAPKKKEVRFNVDEEFMKRLADQLQEENASEVAREALTLLKWAADEVKAGRVILSAQPDGKDVQRLYTPGLAKVK